MPELGRKYTCYSCNTKFYDLGKPVPLCPKCGADQRDADETPVYTAPRGRRVAEPAEVEEEELTPAPAADAADGDDDEGFVPAADEREEEPEEDEEEY